MRDSVSGPPHALEAHIWLLHESFLQRAGRPLLSDVSTPADALRAFSNSAMAIVSHGTEMDPIFNYGNPTALNLFEMDWDRFTRTPSRHSAELPERGERMRLLNTVSQDGIIHDYSGIRISATGRRFRIFQASVWNLQDPSGNYRGQAAAFANWEFLEADTALCPNPSS